MIFVRTLGRTLCVDATPSDGVERVKRAIEARERIPAAAQRLLFEGAQLEDGRALGEYRVSRDATLHLALRLRGGGGDGGVVATQRRYMRSTFKNSYKSRAGAKGANYGAGATGGDEETCGSVDPRLIARYATLHLDRVDLSKAVGG